MKYNIAIVGATGTVGREILNILAERNFPVGEISALASSQSVGAEVSFGENNELTIQNLTNFNFTGVDFVFSAVNASLSSEFTPKAAASGAIVIDNSSCFRMEPEIPLIVPEVNGEILNGQRQQIIASPNCVAIPLTTALEPLHNLAGIKRLVISTYQSTSGAGRKAMDELFNQTKAIFMNGTVEPKKFTKQIAFNLIPHIDAFNDDGFTGEETKVINETKKILDPNIEIVATCVRVPVFIGHAISAAIEFDTPIDEEQAREALINKPGLELIDYHTDGGYITPVECAGEDRVFISRLRRDPTVPSGILMWIVADNLRKGAALNTVQIAETLIAA